MESRPMKQCHSHKKTNLQIFHSVSLERQNRKVQIGPFYGHQNDPVFHFK